MCIWCVMMGEHICEDQMTTLWSWFSISTFTWVPVIKITLWCWHNMGLNLLSHPTNLIKNYSLHFDSLSWDKCKIMKWPFCCKKVEEAEWWSCMELELYQRYWHKYQLCRWGSYLIGPVPSGRIGTRKSWGSGLHVHWAISANSRCSPPPPHSPNIPHRWLETSHLPWGLFDLFSTN